MRKGLTIALLVLAGAVLVAFLFRPWETSVEYHKRKYLSANDVRWKHRWEVMRSRIMGEDRRGVQFDFEGVKYHQGALLRLGYLEQREFVISNRALDAVMSHVAGWVVHTSPNGEFYRYVTPAPNRVVIVAAREDMSKIAAVIRKADVPE